MEEGIGSVVGILMGSSSDANTVLKAKEVLDKFGVSSEVRVISAHRTPDQVVEWAKSAESRGICIIIAAAGMAAHLAGVVAANTRLPVLGVPLSGGLMGGLDSLLSTVQMPRGTPVATFAIDSAGAINAALFALKVLALSRSELRDKLNTYYSEQVDEVLEKERQLLK